MEAIKLLVFDIDGTLIDRTQTDIQPSTKLAIKKAREKGYEVLVATGRSFFLIQDDVRTSINPDYYVSVNGACLNNQDGSILLTHGFSEESIKRLIDYCLKHQFPIGVKYADYIGVYGDYDAFASQYMGSDHPKNIFLKHDLDHTFFKKDEPLGVFYFAKAETLADIEGELSDLKFMPSDRDAIEVVRSDVDKTKGIEDILKKLNIDWDAVMTFGDGHNDIDMLQAAAVGVAMGNAHSDVQAQADYVTDTVLNDGIQKALKHFNII